MNSYDEGVVLLFQFHGHTYAHTLEYAHTINAKAILLPSSSYTRPPTSIRDLSANHK